jgi:alkanesulfonate monooxygenase SsuD/methylene tetrahydromethanopterin reductase-like flavin-dependent oxidoreductase (luciferase family)
MHTGVYYDMVNPPQWERPWQGFYERTLEQIVEAERLGIGAAWFAEHHFWHDGYLPQPMTMAAAVAARTSRIRIGTAVTIAPLRSAADIAEQAAMVDLISDGRFELGLGAGYVKPEFAGYGRTGEGRFEDVEQRAIEVRRLWDDGIVTPRPLQEHLPIWVGGTGQRTARIAGRTRRRSAVAGSSAPAGLSGEPDRRRT